MKKILALVLAVAMMAFAFAGCGKSESITITEGTLTMGTNATFPPYEYTDENGDIIGIDAEIAEAIAEELGLKLEIKDMEFDSLIPAVKAGSIDIAFAGMTVNDERKESVDFSDTYAKGVQVIIVPEDSKIASPDDLEGKKIGVQAGTTGDIYCTDDFGQENVKQFNNGALAVTALTQGQVDCVIIDNEPAKNFVKSNKGLKILETSYADEDYAAAVSKENNELLKKVNEAMKTLKDNGKIDEIISKYIKAE